MAPWELHEIFPSLDIENYFEYQNYFSLNWWENCQKIDSDLTFSVTHVVKFLKYISQINVIHDDVLIRLFLLYLEVIKNNWVKHSLNPKKHIFSHGFH
jgi:hypothetical protein